MVDKKPPWILAPNLAERTKKARKEKSDFRNSEEFWKIGFGDYGKAPSEGSDFSELLEKRKEALAGIEKGLLERVLTILKIKEKAGEDSPAVMIDFGGMYGLSFLKIAAVLERRKQYISQGKIAVVVTSLEFTPEYGLETAGKGYNDITDEEKDVVENYRHLVHYIKSDAAELRHQKITLPNGEVIPLHQNIDVLHEDFALAHGKKNDVDLPLIARSMSPYGTIFLGSRYLHPDIFDYYEEMKIREEAHEAGKGNILLEGFRYLNLGEKKQYDVWLGPKAPLIEK